MPDTSKLEKLNRELEKSEKKLRKAINDEKALQHQLKQLTRKERTHRLCTRGGMLESFLQEPVRPFLSGKLLQLMLQCLFIIDSFPQFLFVFLQLPVELYQL